MRVLLAVLTFFLALQAPAKTPSTEIFQNTNKSNLSLEDFKRAWNQKCLHNVTEDSMCFLSEKDINPLGDIERVLIFRGEPGFYPQPATSSYFRQYLSHTACSAGCTPEELAKTLKQEVKTKTSLKDLAEAHLRGEVLSSESSQNVLDPFISFSADPGLAEHFAGRGVVIVASIPKQSITQPDSAHCEEIMDRPGLFYQLNKCAEYFHSEEELEVSGLFFLPKDFVYTILSTYYKY